MSCSLFKLLFWTLCMCKFTLPFDLLRERRPVIYVVCLCVCVCVRCVRPPVAWWVSASGSWPVGGVFYVLFCFNFKSAKAKQTVLVFCLSSAASWLDTWGGCGTTPALYMYMHSYTLIWPFQNVWEEQRRPESCIYCCKSSKTGEKSQTF